MIIVFDWALIVLSSMSGASMIIQAVNIDSSLYLPAYIGLITIGCALMGTAIDLFLAPHTIAPGGVTGLAIVIKKISLSVISI
jgi:hypothetical protein